MDGAENNLGKTPFVPPGHLPQGGQRRGVSLSVAIPPSLGEAPAKQAKGVLT